MVLPRQWASVLIILWFPYFSISRLFFLIHIVQCSNESWSNMCPIWSKWVACRQITLLRKQKNMFKSQFLLISRYYWKWVQKYSLAFLISHMKSIYDLLNISKQFINKIWNEYFIKTNLDKLIKIKLVLRKCENDNALYLSSGVRNYTLRLPVTPIPTKETTYICHQFKLPNDSVSDIIAIEPVLDNARILHHMLLFAFNDEPKGLSYRL